MKLQDKWRDVSWMKNTEEVAQVEADLRQLQIAMEETAARKQKYLAMVEEVVPTSTVSADWSSGLLSAPTTHTGSWYPTSIGTREPVAIELSPRAKNVAEKVAAAIMAFEHGLIDEDTLVQALGTDLSVVIEDIKCR